MTAQIPEILILDGITHPMTCCPALPPEGARLNYNIRHEMVPMEIPDGPGRTMPGRTLPHRTRIIARWIDGAGIERQAEEESVVLSTACGRRYRGTWRIDDGSLFLAGLTGCVRLARPGPLFADWFSGVLRVPLGDEVRFVDEGFSTSYEGEMHVMVERGFVRGRLALDHTSSRMALRCCMPELPFWEEPPRAPDFRPAQDVPGQSPFGS
jgi:hypothetical protein